MTPFIFPVVCDVCGEKGYGTTKTASAEWLAGYTVYHTNPKVCADNLAQKKKNMEQRKKEADSPA